MSRFALDSESDAVGSLGLDLEVGCREDISPPSSDVYKRDRVPKFTSTGVIEILGQELYTSCDVD